MKLSCLTVHRVATCVLLTMLLSACALAEQYKWTGVERIVAVSDPHGAYGPLLDTLKNAGLIDAERAWIGAASHLVITGDLLDRGSDSRAIMDLIMRLETEAVASGGMVHLTLGNHEVMNLVGDLRYVSSGEYAAFASEESAAERERWFKHYRDARVLAGDQLLDEAEILADFDKTHPPGIFGHRDAFSAEGKYGRWLLQKPLMVVINDTAFVHGGLSPLVAELGLNELNIQLGAEVGDYVRQRDVLTAAELISPAENFYDVDELAEDLLLNESLTDETKIALQTVIDLSDADVHGSSSPLWYRGSVGCGPLTEGDVIANALAAIGANRVVIGHTPTVTRQVLQRHNGQIIEIDTGMLRSSYGGSGNALIIAGDQLTVVNESGSRSDSPAQHPRRVGARDDALSAAELEQILASADIVATQVDATNRQIVELHRGGDSVRALFVPSPRAKGVNTELAAYQLDRLMGLDMVPVTVAREVDGRAGTLQFLPDMVRDESERAASGQGGSAWCPLPRQWNSMYIFDALVHTEFRAPSSIVYSPENWQLSLMGHTSSFGTKRGRPSYLANVELQLSATWVEALQGLSDDVLKENLGDVLDRRRINALAKRRDALLQEVSESR